MAGFEYRTNSTVAEIAAALRGARRVVITTHAKPDGDALGSVLALGAALQGLGIVVERWVMPPVPENLSVIRRGEHLHMLGGDAAHLPDGEPDLIVVTDTGAWRQVEPMRAWLAARHDRVIVLDHHLHGDDLGAMIYVDTSAAAVCEVIAEVIDALGVGFDERVAAALYVGLATDTGWFRFSNTTARSHLLAARLMGCGIDHGALYVAVEQSERPAKLALWAQGLERLEIVAGGRAAVMTLHNTDFEALGARHEETERLVDIPQIVGSVRVVVLITESGEGQTRLSFRSKPGPGAIDVNALAGRFGGGGHARAAGARVEGAVDDVRRQIVEALEALPWPAHDVPAGA